MLPLPELTRENTPFWTAGERGELVIVFCDDCTHAIHPPQLLCPACQSRNVGPRAMPGTGKIYTFTVNHQPWIPGMDVPFVLAVVDVDGAPGVRVTARLAGCDPEDVRIEQGVRIGFAQSGDVWLPHWHLVAGATA